MQHDSSNMQYSDVMDSKNWRYWGYVMPHDKSLGSFMVSARNGHHQFTQRFINSTILWLVPVM